MAVLVPMVYLLTASGQIESVDGMLSLEMARNWVNNGNFEPSDPRYGIGGAVMKSTDGHYFSSASKGLAVAYIPAVVITKAVYDHFGYQPARYFPLESDYLLTLLASFTNPILGIVLFWLNWQLLLQIGGKNKLALVVAVLISLTTNLWPLAKHSFPNLLIVVEEVALLLAVVRWKKYKYWVDLLLAIIIGGLLIFSYNLTVVLIFVLAGYFVVDDWPFRKKMGLFGVCFLVGVVFVLRMGGVVWLKNMLNGEGGSRDVFQAVWGMLLSPGRSITIYSPIWGLALVMAFATWRQSVWSRLMIFGTVVFVGFYSMFDIWSGELSWGPRYMAPLIPLAGLALVDSWKSLNKKWLVGLALFGLYVQLVGVTVPFDTQYQGIKLGNFSEASIKTRQDQFDYWTLGEFLPKYSPIYRLKTNFIHRLILIPNYFDKRPEVIFAGGVTLPIDNSGKRWAGKKINLTALGPSKLDLEEVRVFVGDEEIQIESVVAKESLVEISLKTDSDRQPITKLLIGNREVSMKSYSLGLEDGFLGEAEMTDDREVLYQRYYDRKAVANLTADFWWVRQLVYFR